MIMLPESQVTILSEEVIAFLKEHPDMKELNVGEWISILAGVIFTLGYYKGVDR